MSDQQQPWEQSNNFATGVCLIDEDEYGEEPTRRIGGGGFSIEPTSFMAPQYAAPEVQTFSAKPTALPPSNAIPALPSFTHPIDHNAAFCPHVAEPSMILDRLVPVLDSQFIDFSSLQEEENKIKCTTMDGVEFRIFLWKGKQQFSHGMIVEVQRRSGNTWGFDVLAKQLLDAAQGKPVDTTAMDACCCPPPPPMPSSQQQEEANLGFVKTLMGLNPQLALQTLSSMVSKMGEATARSASKQLLGSELELGNQVLQHAKNDIMALQILYHVVSSTSGLSPALVNTISSVVQESKVEQKALKQKILNELHVN